MNNIESLYVSAPIENQSFFEACCNISDRIIAYAKENGIDAVQQRDAEIHQLLVDHPYWVRSIQAKEALAAAIAHTQLTEAYNFAIRTGKKPQAEVPPLDEKHYPFLKQYNPDYQYEDYSKDIHKLQLTVAERIRANRFYFAEWLKIIVVI